MKLEVGQFVRTKDGKIFDCYVSEQMGKTIYYPKRSKTNGYIDWNEVYKKSENIINILEVGDYVNGYPVYEIIEYEDNTRAIVIGDDNKSIIWEESSQYIKSIVTHEQMEQMAYKVGD